jgi:hypothetical protein
LEVFVRKAFHSWVEKHGNRFADDEKFETKVRKWLKQQSKTSMLRADVLEKRWDNCSIIVGGYVEK